MPNIHKPFHQKYRPNNLDELVGQKFISITLKQALLTNKIAPAYLFNGPRGTGKTSSARIFAKSLNCQAFDQPTIKPCCKCDLCKQITDGSALDIIEIDAASNTGVENIREFTITKKMVDNLFSSKIVKLPAGTKRIIKESA